MPKVRARIDSEATLTQPNEHGKCPTGGLIRSHVGRARLFAPDNYDQVQTFRYDCRATIGLLPDLPDCWPICFPPCRYSLGGMASGLDHSPSRADLAASSAALHLFQVRVEPVSDDFPDRPPIFVYSLDLDRYRLSVDEI
jgi:hypothetical protein